MRFLLPILMAVPLFAQTPEQLDVHGGAAVSTTYQGKSAVRIDAAPGAGNGASFATDRSNFRCEESLVSDRQNFHLKSRGMTNIP